MECFIYLSCSFVYLIYFSMYPLTCSSLSADLESKEFPEQLAAILTQWWVFSKYGRLNGCCPLRPKLNLYP